MRIDRPIAIVIVLLATVLLSFFFVVPEYKNFKKFQNDLGYKKAEYLAKFDYYSEIAKIYENINERKEDMQKVNGALPSETDYGQLVYYLQKKCGENGLAVKSMGLSQSSVSTGVKDIVFSINLSGDYSSLEDLITDLERSARIFEISRVSFGSQVFQETAVQNKQAQAKKTSEVTQFQVPGTFNFTLELRTHSY